MHACLRLLGPVALEGPDGPVPVGGPKERRLLAVLGVHAGEVVGEERLIDALWGDAPPRTANKTLQNHVLHLRRAMDGLAARIVTRRPGYVLTDATTDVTRVGQLIARARAATTRGNHEEAVARFEESLALWRGPALLEVADLPFATAEAARLDELREAAREERVAALVAAGRHREAVAEAETLVAAAPLRERRWSDLMLALYRDGRAAEALEAGRRLREHLAATLGVDPGPAARALEASILAHDPGLLPAAPPTPAGGPAPSPCVGRRPELDRLDAVLAEVRAGRGRVALLHGEPGIGKTRLLAEVERTAAAGGAEVLRGRCLEGAGARPYAPFADALADLPGAPSFVPIADEGARLPPDERRLRLLDAVARLLADRAGARPVVLLLDDLHWADEAGVALLRHVARAGTALPLLIVGTYRSDEVPDTHPLADALGALAREAECRSLRLAGLDDGALGELLAAQLGAPVVDELAADIRRETGGNPFFARELARHLEEDGALHTGRDGRRRRTGTGAVIPDGVRHVVARRRRRLPDAANRLLEAAAAVEGPFGYEAARVVAGLDDADGLAALDAVLAAGLVVADRAPDRYDVTHALVRHTVYDGLNPSRRLRLHRDLAEALAAARAAGTPVDPAEIAVQYHRSAALPGAAAGVDAALAAAARSEAVGAPDEQARFLDIARALLPADDPRHGELLGELALARAWARQFDGAVEAARSAGAVGAEVLARIATTLAGAGSNRHAWEVAARGLAAMGGIADGTPAGATLTLLDLDRREANDPEHPGMQLDLPGRRAALRVLYESGRLAGRGDLGRYAVAAIHSRRDRVPPQAGDDPTVAAYLLGDYAGAAPRFAAAADEAEARGRLALAVYCRAGQSRCETALGEIAAARETLRQVRALVARVPDLPLSWQLLHHQGAEDALVLALGDGWDERATAFAPWMRPGPGQHWGIAAITAIGARIEAHRGHGERAMALLSRPVRALRQAPAWAPNHARTAFEVAETLWLLDRRDHLDVVEAALREKALPADFRFPMTDSRLALARLCVLTGRVEEAAGWFERARVVLDAQGARPLRAVVDHDQARLHRRGGDDAAARPHAERAAASFAALGMTGWARRERSVRL